MGCSERPVSEPVPYTVRESTRAKHVRLRMDRRHGLEVVIPRGFDRSGIADVLEAQRPWIERAAARVERERMLLSPEPADGLPDRIELPAVDEVFLVEYRQTDTGSVSVREGGDGRLLVSGSVDNVEACRAALCRWLHRRGRTLLVPWLTHVAKEHGFAVRRVSIRMQKTRWGSASSSGTITLNAKLLLMPPELVEHVIVHELCHTRHPNHSQRFYACMAQHEPDHRRHRHELRSAWRFVPRWAEA